MNSNLEGGLPGHGHVGADEAYAQLWIRLAQRLGHLHVVGERRRARVQDRQVVVARQRRHLGQREAGRRRVDQPRALDQRGGLGQPRRIPERAHLAARLVAGAGPAVEAFERGRVQEERAEEGHPF